jgi:glycolate oxidase iron-sulfur subunit
MQTQFSDARLADPLIKEANDILRTCVHCGFCLATCPTYVLLGDELDSPRGRIYLAKTMLETDQPATAAVVKHFDRCLTCLSCQTTCPSGVKYAPLLDRARAHAEATHTRPAGDRLLRRLLAFLVPRPALFRLAVLGGKLSRPIAGLLPGRMKGMAAMAPARLRGPSHVDAPQTFPAMGARRKRVALMTGCAQQVLRPEINEATVRLLTRHGCEVVVAKGAGCCGAIDHHFGWQEKAKAAARANVAAWWAEHLREPLDAVVFNASGCGVSLVDYGHLLADDAAWAAPARHIAGISRDVSQIMLDLGLVVTTPPAPAPLRVTYHTACSMQHGLGLRTHAKQLLSDAGFAVREPAEGHICCGSAGTYSILQPDLSVQLRDRKLAAIAATGPAVIAAGNIGCMTHLAGATTTPVVHTVELLDWATGGPKPAEMR